MVSFEIFVKSMLPSLSELKVIPSFCFAFKIPDDVTATTLYYKWDVENDFAYVLQFFSLTSDSLSRVKNVMTARSSLDID